MRFLKQSLQKNIKSFIELLENAKTRPPLPVGALLWDKLVEARDYVLTGKKSVEKALWDAQNEVQNEYNKVMKKQGWQT